MLLFKTDNNTNLVEFLQDTIYLNLHSHVTCQMSNLTQLYSYPRRMITLVDTLGH